MENNENTGIIEIADHLIDNLYTDYAKEFGNGLVYGDFSQFAAHLDAESELFIYRFKKLTGVSEIVDYWKGWRDRFVVTKTVTDFAVVHSNYFGHSCLQMATMVAAMQIVDGIIVKMILMTRHPAQIDYNKHNDVVNEFPLRLSYLEGHLGTDEGIEKEYRIPCFRCGVLSENLIWHSSSIKERSFEYKAEVSVCPCCGKVIEYYNTGRTRLKMDEPEDSYEIPDDERANEQNKNGFSDNGVEFLDVLQNMVIKGQCKDEVFSCLSSLSPRKGCHLGLRLARQDDDERGDVSNFFIYKDNGFEDINILSHLTVKSTVEGAWQAYLLMSAQTEMPTFWHGGYVSRRLIFRESDLEVIRPLRVLDYSSLKQSDLLPSVTLSKQSGKGEYKADVYCCYWNDWKGLVREHATISIKYGRITSYNAVGDWVIYEYDCGIYF